MTFLRSSLLKTYLIDSGICPYLALPLLVRPSVSTRVVSYVAYAHEDLE
jgi:hypothetical protein